MEESQIGEVQPGPRRSEGEVSLARAFGGRSLLREMLETVLLTVILFLVLNTATGRSQVNGSSMEPTLYDGQYLLISKLTYWLHPPQRGDIVVLHPPVHLGEDYIKRIVGLPGERVEVRDGKVWVDGVLLEEPYISSAPAYVGVWDLGEAEYFVLGDNRNDSSDSHTWGVLPRGNIIGKAWFCYWPPGRWGGVSHYTFREPERFGE